MNAYLAGRGDPVVKTLSDIIALNNAFDPTDLTKALKYGQAIFEAADKVDTSAGSTDTARYLSDRATDLTLARGALDAVYNGPDKVRGTADDFHAILLNGNNLANVAAKAGYPSVTVPGGFITPVPPDPDRQPVPLDGDVYGASVLRADVDRVGLCVRAGDAASCAAAAASATAVGFRDARHEEVKR